MCDRIEHTLYMSCRGQRLLCLWKGLSYSNQHRSPLIIFKSNEGHNCRQLFTELRKIKLFFIRFKVKLKGLFRSSCWPFFLSMVSHCSGCAHCCCRFSSIWISICLCLTFARNQIAKHSICICRIGKSLCGNLNIKAKLLAILFRVAMWFSLNYCKWKYLLLKAASQTQYALANCDL